MQLRQAQFSGTSRSCQNILDALLREGGDARQDLKELIEEASLAIYISKLWVGGMDMVGNSDVKWNFDFPLNIVKALIYLGAPEFFKITYKNLMLTDVCE